MSEHLYTIAELTAKDGRLDALKSILTNLAQETRQETGALEYFFILDQEKPNTILSYEKWSSPAEESLHWATSHLRAAIADMKDVLATDPVIHKGKQII